MRADRKRRWDLMVGVAAALVAMAGLLLSLQFGNTWAVGIGVIDRETQKTLLALAAIFLTLIGIKAGLRFTVVFSKACPTSLERLLQRLPGQGGPPD